MIHKHVFYKNTSNSNDEKYSYRMDTPHSIGQYYFKKSINTFLESLEILPSNKEYQSIVSSSLQSDSNTYVEEVFHIATYISGDCLQNDKDKLGTFRIVFTNNIDIHLIHDFIDDLMAGLCNKIIEVSVQILDQSRSQHKLSKAESSLLMDTIMNKLRLVEIGSLMKIRIESIISDKNTKFVRSTFSSGLFNIDVNGVQGHDPQYIAIQFFHDCFLENCVMKDDKTHNLKKRFHQLNAVQNYYQLICYLERYETSNPSSISCFDDPITELSSLKDDLEVGKQLNEATAVQNQGMVGCLFFLLFFVLPIIVGILKK
jgi:hypothetical protein